ncbi:hypothetical protein LZZ85_26505 [Terrimonas sp. NA20]|uniref:Transmembrane protein n=1 Tax=Terrimonas ginsenosidimutans TaxID=2908004 RepID=A0ABS9KZZ3_9BACT|nr:hypothetical protein [Terrimonas ginsenosidimutans]MCG2617881.1 hypothetical protein [Terrimonas ginsenosidimutans]
MKIHVFNTWILAHGLHPFAMVAMFIAGGTADSMVMEDVYILLFMSCVAMLLAIPTLFVSWYVLPKILRLPSSLLNRFFIWLASGCAIVVINAGVALALVFRMGAEEVIIAVPALVATFVALCVRFKSFIKLAAEYDRPVEPELN